MILLTDSQLRMTQRGSVLWLSRSDWKRETNQGGGVSGLRSPRCRLGAGVLGTNTISIEGFARRRCRYLAIQDLPRGGRSKTAGTGSADSGVVGTAPWTLQTKWLFRRTVSLNVENKRTWRW